MSAPPVASPRGGAQDAAVAEDLVAVAETRERVRALLAQRYAEGILDLDTYEARVEEAEDARELAALQALIADLRPPAVDSQALAVREPAALATAGAGAVATAGAGAVARVTSVFGGVTRGGVWALPARLDVRCVFGNVTLDLREAQISGDAEIHVSVVFGAVDIIAPPGLRVIAEGTSVLGDFSGQHDPTEAVAAGPTVRIVGLAVFSAVSIEQRRVGESSGDARRRRKAERKALRQQARRQLPGA